MDQPDVKVKLEVITFVPASKTCEQCGKSYSSKYEVTRHRRREHGQQPPLSVPAAVEEGSRAARGEQVAALVALAAALSGSSGGHEGPRFADLEAALAGASRRALLAAGGVRRRAGPCWLDGGRRAGCQGSAGKDRLARTGAVVRSGSCVVL